MFFILYDQFVIPRVRIEMNNFRPPNPMNKRAAKSQPTRIIMELLWRRLDPQGLLGTPYANKADVNYETRKL